MQDCTDELIQQVLGAAIKVHKELGAGLLEIIYEKALVLELKRNGLSCRTTKVCFCCIPWE